MLFSDSKMDAAYPSERQRQKVQTMTLIKNDLYRNLGFGFLLGTFVVVLANPALVSAIV